MIVRKALAVVWTVALTFFLSFSAFAQDTYSLAPLIADNTNQAYWASTTGAATLHSFNGASQSGGGNHFGTSNGQFIVTEYIVPVAGNAQRYIVEVGAYNASNFLEPWVDASWAGSNLTQWILEVGTASGGGNPISPGFAFTVVNSGVFIYDSAGNQTGNFALFADTSSNTLLGGTALINLGGSDIAGYDLAGMQLYWDITPAQADLALQLIDVPNGTFSPGDAIDIQNNTTNIGGSTSSTYVITAYASTDTNITSSDFIIGSEARPGLAAGQAHNILTTTSLPLDLPAGSYYIGAILTVSDANSSNNRNHDAAPITVEASPVDIALTFIDPDAGSYLPGSALDVWTGFENLSSTATGDFLTNFYASTDTNITSGDRLIGSYNIFSLDPSAAPRFPLEVILPNDLASGDYFVGAILDVSDANSGNNVINAPVPITVATTPEILVQPLALNFTAGSSVTAESINGAESIDGDAPAAKPELIFQDYQLPRGFKADLMKKAIKEGTVRVIVGFDTQFQPEGLLQTTAGQSQRQTVLATGNQLLSSLRGFTFDENARYESIPFMALTVDAVALAHLQISPLVTSIEEDKLSKPYLSTSNQVIGSPLAWTEGYDGTGQTVAILDSGVDKSHPWFNGNGAKVVSEACYSSNSPGIAETVCPGGVESSTSAGSGVHCEVETCDHGTHVAGIAAGNDGTGPYYGTARGADIIAVQVFTKIIDAEICGGVAPCIRTLTSDQLSALERVYALRNSFSISSVNMSLGGGQHQSTCDAENTSLKAAIDNLRSVGIATVIATGNEGFRDSIGAPACISTAISVGNTRRNDEVSQSSSVYPEIHLLAPGTDIDSSIPGGGTGFKTGTSMSTPHVAGAWAVLKQINPGASVTEILTKLQTTSTSVDDNRTGGTEQDMPRINLDAAMNIDRTTFGVFNKGPGDLEVTSIAPATSAPWISLSIATPFTVPANQMRVVGVDIDYTGAPSGSSQVRLLINSNDGNESPYPNGVNINVTKSQVAVPSTPTGVNASDGTFSDKVRITWSNVSSEKSYRVFRCSTANSSSCGVAIASPGVNVTSYDDVGANSNGSVHHYRIKACNDGGCSGFSGANTGYRLADDVIMEDGFE